MIQIIIIGIVFSVALVFLGNKIRKQFSSRESSCPKGCGCTSADFDKIEAELKKSSESGVVSIE